MTQNHPHGTPRVASVCTVVLNWNRATETLECLDSLLPGVQDRQTALVVCDNASQDDSVSRIVDWAVGHFEQFKFVMPSALSCLTRVPDWDFLLIRNHVNRGFGGGVNAAVQLALRRPEFKYIWILNNDCVVDEHALTSLLDCAANREDVGLFGSTLVDDADRVTVESAGGCRYHPVTTVFTPVLGGVSLHDVRALEADPGLDYVGGASMFFRADALRRVGLFDERFFLYYEELDLALRLRVFGYQQAWCPHAVVYHKGGASTGARAGSAGSASWLSGYHENLSTLLFTRKHYPYLLPLVAMVRFAGKSFRYFQHGRWHMFSALFRAYRDAFAGVSGRVGAVDADVIFTGFHHDRERCGR